MMATLLRTPDPAVERLLARWAVAATSRIEAFGPEQWDTWGTRMLLTSITSGTNLDEALTRYVTDRERACFTREEILADLASLASVEDRAAKVLNDASAGVLIADTYRSSAVSNVLDAWAQLPGSSYLAERISEEYRSIRADGGQPSDELFITCLHLPRSASFTDRMSLTLDVAERLRQQYPRTPIGCLTRVLFVALGWRRLTDRNVTAEGLPEGVDTQVVELPETAEGISRLLSDIAAAG